MDLRTRRERLALSQDQVAEISGITQALVSFLELGKGGPATSLRLATLQGLAKALQCSVDDVVRGVERARRSRAREARVSEAKAS